MTKFSNIIQFLNNKKLFKISVILYVIFFVINYLFSSLHQQEVKSGEEIIYVMNVFLLTLVCINLVLWGLSLQSIKNIKLKYHKFIALLLVSTVTLISLSNLSKGIDYVKDLFCEPYETTTNEYMISSKTNLLSFMEQNKRLEIKVTDEKVNMLSDNKLLSHNIVEICSLNGLFYYENPIYIKYYPNSKVLVETYLN